MTRTARIRPGWEQYWKDLTAKLNTTMPDLGSLHDGASVRLVEGSDTYHKIHGRFVDIVGIDGKTGSINYEMLEDVHETS